MHKMIEVIVRMGRKGARGYEKRTFEVEIELTLRELFELVRANNEAGGEWELRDERGRNRSRSNDPVWEGGGYFFHAKNAILRPRRRK